MATSAQAWTIQSQAEDLSGLILKDIVIPQDIGEHEVLVEMRAASLNYRELVIVKVRPTSMGNRIPHHSHNSGSTRPSVPSGCDSWL